MEITEYKKLPGTGLRRVGFISLAASRSRLYLGTDHLLSADSMYGSETYKRFYFRDIQAFTVRRTPWGLVSVLIFGGLLGLSALGLLSADPVTFGFGTVFTVLFSLFFLAFLIQQLVRGGTCRTWVQTAVQTEELPSLNRVNTSRKVLARLQPLILAAQPAPAGANATPATEATPTPSPADATEPGAAANP
jgi:hypothetical protein